ncbi:portal protein [uncultured Mediterranean phage uvMED]|nr:portal protein [uncultured Mediterranean phage uvMED]
MAKKIIEIADPKLRTILSNQIKNALGYLGGQLSQSRKKSVEYYLGDKLGTEIDGRSQVVSTDVADTVESVLPSLLRIFTASDKVVRCDPVTAEDVPLADQATAYINHVFYKDNNGFELLYNFFKDALIEKNGFLKVYYDESQKVEHETYKNLTQAEKDALNDTKDEIEEVEEEIIVDEKAKEAFEKQVEALEAQGLDTSQIQEPNFNLYNCKIKRITKQGKIKIESIPPEEFLIDRTAKSIDDAEFVSHKVLMTRSQIIEMGFDEEEVMKLPTSSVDIYNNEEIVRQRNIDEYPVDTPADKSTEKVLLYESYVRYDYDGDGIAELRKIISAGDDGYAVLENMPCDNIPFVTVTPIPMPHRFYGRSISELVEDIQLMKSTVMRQLLDNMYLTNNNRVAIMDGMVNMDDLLTTRPGGVVRTKQPPNQVMQPLQAQPISQQAFPLLSYLDSVREVRTGISKQVQGLDPNTLNAKTATGVNALMTQTQMRSELIARIFAETGVKDLFRKIFELMVKYQDKERIVMLNNQYVPVKPTEWKDKFNINIVVGLGTGSKEQQILLLNNILERQIQAFSLQGGKEMPMVTLKNMYNTLSKIIENAGLKNVESYFVDPDLGKQMMQPPAPPPLTPIEKIEFTRIDSENKRKIADLELQYQELQQKSQEMALSFEAKIKEMALKYNTQLDTAKLKADADLDKMIMAGNSKILEQAQKSANMFSQQVQNLNGNQRPSQEISRSQPIQPGKTDIEE